NGTLYQQALVAMLLGPLTVQLLVTERHIEVTEGMQGQHGYIEIAINQRNPAHPVITHEIGIRIGCHPRNLLVEFELLGSRRRAWRPAVDLLLVAVIVQCKIAIDVALRAAGTEHRILHASDGEALLENGAVSSRAVPGDLHQP